MIKPNKKIITKTIKKKFSKAIVHIKTSFNNTIISITDNKGNVIAWASSGSCGFKGARKGTPFAAQTACEMAIKKGIEQGIRQIEININGPGSGRETAIRSIQNKGLIITLIKDTTPISHNGCRSKKKRRV
uniref:Small ribosomal subunit protein uS11c n=1 Tax=Discoplastis spathirhyncha TaxID=215771 RepID=A0A3G3LLB5_9EUGL|nr:ribosomal protein S11 [Discoplastis spathirhyncha]AYQ93497.1 ribosomal protein S11 [Discoplastis spathirhyncha]